VKRRSILDIEEKIQAEIEKTEEEIRGYKDYIKGQSSLLEGLISFSNGLFAALKIVQEKEEGNNNGEDQPGEGEENRVGDSKVHGDAEEPLREGGSSRASTDLS